MHFQWMERGQNFPEDDLVVFPEEANFEKVQESSDRVYVLKFRQDDRKYFLWMQEPSVNGDVPLSNLVNFYLNGPQENDQDAEDQVITSQSSPKDPQNAEARRSKKSTEEVFPSNAATWQTLLPPQGRVQLADLQRILSTIRPSETNSEAILPQDTGPSLSEILKPELVVPLLEDCHLEERLAPFLPEGPWTSEAIAELIQSPQFHQQVDAFTHVLRSGQIDLAQFGIDSSKYNFTVSSFLEAIEDQAVENSEPSHVSIPEETALTGHEVSDESCQKKSDCKGDPMEEGR